MRLPPTAPYAAELTAAIDVATGAAAAITAVAQAATYVKDDGSPVTDADLASDRIIRDGLAQRFPNEAILTEESADSAARLSTERCWIVDPLDGTKQFVAGTVDYDVLIALVVAGRPVVAVSCNPPTGLVCWAVAGRGAWVGGDDDWGPLRPPSQHPGEQPTIVTSVWYGAPDSVPLLTRALGRDGLAAPPVLDTGFNPRYWAEAGRRLDAFVGWVPEGWMSGGEWDLVVTDLIVNEAGGVCTRLGGERHRYNKPDARNSGGILLAADAELHARLLRLLKPELERIAR